MAPRRPARRGWPVQCGPLSNEPDEQFHSLGDDRFHGLAVHVIWHFFPLLSFAAHSGRLMMETIRVLSGAKLDDARKIKKGLKPCSSSIAPDSTNSGCACILGARSPATQASSRTMTAAGIIEQGTMRGHPFTREPGATQ